jgi:hypothetical protein
MVEYIPGVLTFANFLIATFILIFAMSFLRKTKDAKDRKPWLFLLIAVLVFFVMQFVNILGLAGFFPLDYYRSYFDSMFLAIILFTFVFQYNLILNSELILISRKNAEYDIQLKRAAATRQKIVSSRTKKTSRRSTSQANKTSAAKQSTKKKTTKKNKN